MTAYVFLIVDKKRESLQQFTLQTLSLVVWIVSYRKQKDLSRGSGIILLPSYIQLVCTEYFQVWSSSSVCISAALVSLLYILELSRMLYATLVSVPVPVSLVICSCSYSCQFCLYLCCISWSYLTISSVALYTFGSFQILDIRKP